MKQELAIVGLARWVVVTMCVLGQMVHMSAQSGELVVGSKPLVVPCSWALLGGE